MLWNFVQYVCLVVGRFANELGKVDLNEPGYLIWSRWDLVTRWNWRLISLIFLSLYIMNTFTKLIQDFYYWLWGSYMLRRYWKNLDHSFYEKLKFLPLVRTRTCAYQGVRNVSFSEHLRIARTKLIIPNDKFIV